jgi:hypothetical protein
VKVKPWEGSDTQKNVAEFTGDGLTDVLFHFTKGKQRDSLNKRCFFYTPYETKFTLSGLSLLK